MSDAGDLMERVCYITDEERDLLLVYLAKRCPDMVEAALNAIEEVKLA